MCIVLTQVYIQITYVEPYFDLYELRQRVAFFDRNFNISQCFLLCSCCVIMRLISKADYDAATQLTALLSVALLDQRVPEMAVTCDLNEVHMLQVVGHPLP